ncbi:response regulator [Chitinophaga polysaccharea]|uniref:hybrid sensor histidine kinase/response regulator n=1 Tax=Chitinophaga TaxID=79328 RepID=UPI00145594F1|nr:MULTISPECIES: hybrid sensor histidine kinase/response regulator [Chitinophaga]NLR58014.1 response regulator [Chitinophaga polysaccharea]NLU93607.1 response regulator [Chitinophaga sp. Ak27]
MQPKRIKYYLLGLFITGMILFVVLQFNSANNIRKLIKGNEQLLQELNVKNELQKLQTNMARTDSKVRGAVISQDTTHITGIEAEIAVIKADLKEINKIIKNDSTERLLTQLNYLVDEKNNFNLMVLDTFYSNGKWAAERMINNQKGKRLGEAINSIIRQLDTTRQTEVNRTTHLIDSSGQKAQSWGSVLVFFACLTSLLAFLYITSRIHRQEQLIEALDASQQQEKKLAAVKDQFLANMSHEIRTPMNAVLGFTHLLKAQPLTDKSKEYVGAIENAGQSLLEIINDILDISKIESGMMRIEASAFSLRSVLHGVNTMFKPKAEEKQLQLSVTIDDNVPDILYGDVMRLTQVLVNLASNAVKFTQEGSVHIHAAKIWAEDNAVRILFTVSDTGIGIDPSKLDAIFDRFNQAEASTTRKFGGTGLGLTIVKQLIELQNGFISVESKPGEGTTFKVELPYTLADSLLEEGNSYFTENDQLPLHPDVRILVAEDNKLNQNLLRHLLTGWHLQYKIVTNGKEVLQALDKQHFDLVLMDIQMPEMDGYSAVQAIRNELHSTIPVIAMTAHAMTGEREKCLQMGMNEYISKPIIEEELYKLIQVYIGKLPPRELPATNYLPHENGTHQLINMHYLHDLSKGNTSFEKNMLEQFIAQLPEELSLLKKAVAAEDIAAIRASAHNLKTTVSFIGLEDHLYPILEPLEKVQENNYHAAVVAGQFNTLKHLCIQAVQEAINILL